MFLRDNLNTTEGEIMKRLASEVLRNLEMRIAKLEKQAKTLISRPTTTTQLFKIEKNSIWKYIFRGLKKIGVSPKDVVIESLEVQGGFDPVSELYEVYVLIFSIPSRNIYGLELVWGGPASLMKPKVKPSVKYNGRVYPAGKGGGTGFVKALELIIFNEADVLRSREESKRLKSLERAKAREEAKDRKEREEREEEEYQERKRRRSLPPELWRIGKYIEGLNRQYEVHEEGMNSIVIDLGPDRNDGKSDYLYSDQYSHDLLNSQTDMLEQRIKSRFPSIVPYWGKEIKFGYGDKGYYYLNITNKYRKLAEDFLD